MTRSPAPVASHLFPGSTATLRTQPKCPEMTRTSFHGAWYVGLTVRVVLCSVSACESFEALVNADTRCSGVVSMEAIIFVVSDEGPAVMALRISLGRAGPTGTCCAMRAGGSCLQCLYSSFIFTAKRNRALGRMSSEARRKERILEHTFSPLLVNQHPGTKQRRNMFSLRST